MDAIDFDAHSLQIKRMSVNNPANAEVPHTVETTYRVCTPLRAQQFLSIRVD